MSSWEDYLENQIVEAELPKPEREYKFLKNRRFRFDFCWPNNNFAVEVDGGVYNRSRHTTGAGYSRDCCKFALATIEGYKIIRVTTGQVSSGEAIEWIKAYFEKQVKL